jgi:hypothetical protein
MYRPYNPEDPKGRRMRRDTWHAELRPAKHARYSFYIARQDARIVARALFLPLHTCNG